MPPADGIHSAALHLLEWFVDLNRTREAVVVAGLGGGASFPKSISWQELAAWMAVTGTRPTGWETRTLTIMDNAWLAAGSGQGNGGKQYQEVGGYCHGAEVENCRKTFGEQLERVCSTCPE